MTDFTVEQQPTTQSSPRRLPPIKLLIGVFIVSMLVSGAIIYVVLDQLVETSTSPDISEFILNAEGGVREISPPRAVADFTLTAHTGESFSLSDLQGQNVLLYFGYTHCPDVCPLTLMDMQQVEDIIGDEVENMAYVFVSVDGARDTPAYMANYLERRRVNDMVIGLTGEEVVLNRITPDYGLYYNLNEPQPNGYYDVDHTASLFLLNAEGELTHIFAYGTDPAVIAENIVAMQ